MAIGAAVHWSKGGHLQANGTLDPLLQAFLEQLLVLEKSLVFRLPVLLGHKPVIVKIRHVPGVTASAQMSLMKRPNWWEIEKVKVGM